MGYKVSVCLEMPIGLESTDLGIEMAKGNLTQIQTTFGCH